MAPAPAPAFAAGRMDRFTARAFGAAPALPAVLLVINMVRRTVKEMHAILGIHEVKGRTVKSFVPEGGRYSQGAVRLPQVRRDLSEIPQGPLFTMAFPVRQCLSIGACSLPGYLVSLPERGGP